MREPVSALDLESAHATLDQLMAAVGVDGLVAAMQHPGLLALIDQHAAAIRESLGRSDQAMEPIALARYARSVVAVAARHTVLPEDLSTVDWMSADWYLLRLVAVCALADSDDCFGGQQR